MVLEVDPEQVANEDCEAERYVTADMDVGMMVHTNGQHQTHIEILEDGKRFDCLRSVRLWFCVDQASIYRS